MATAQVRGSDAYDLASLFSDDFRRFCGKHGIALAILFGSQAVGRATRESALDLAVWLERVELLSDTREGARARRQLLKDLAD